MGLGSGAMDNKLPTPLLLRPDSAVAGGWNDLDATCGYVVCLFNTDMSNEGRFLKRLFI
jgi:hypothetical protein